MQGSVEISAHILDTLIQQGGSCLYEKYLSTKIPDHLGAQEITQLKAISDN